MRILQVEDDHATAQSVELMMKSEGFNVYSTDLGEEGVDLAKTYDYDLILLDLNLPDIHGIEVLRQIRAAQIKTPVMIVSGCSDITVKVKTFGLGADDYLQKPFHKDELIARAHSIIRRSKGHAEAIIHVGPIAVNLDAKTVTVDGRQVHLTGKEHSFLELLALRLETTVTKEAVMNHLYGGLDEPELKIVDVFCCKLRSKLRAAGAPAHIRTIWGRGYTLSVTPGEDRERRKGVGDSLTSKTLGALSNENPIGSTDLAAALKVTKPSIQSMLKTLRERDWVSMHGSGRSAVWRITPAGLAEHQRRNALAAAA